MADHQVQKSGKDDPFLLNYDADELRIASEFLTNWLPFLSRGLCGNCTLTLSHRIRSLQLETSSDQGKLKEGRDFEVSTRDNADMNTCSKQDSCCTSSPRFQKDSADSDDNTDTYSLGSWKDGAEELSGPIAETSKSETLCSPAPVETPRMKMSWADMAQEDELEDGEESDTSTPVGNGNGSSSEGTAVKGIKSKTQLSREQREYIRFCNVGRKKDFICLERINGKIVNILDGLQLHTGVFSAAEQKRIVDYVEMLRERGENGQLKDRTYTAPQKWMRGKGRVTIQFGCCYNYATDKNGNAPGILKNEMVDPIPHLLKVMIRRLISWHIMPPSCVPDSCIVNIYEEGDCIPPHIDNHDFVRPFCTVSLLSECNIVFGSNLKVMGAGEFAGSIAIPLPVGSVLILNGNGADVAKHCVPAVPSKRISITFRRMDESKYPVGFVPEPDLQGLQPLSYEDKTKKSNNSTPRYSSRRQLAIREESTGKVNGSGSRSSGSRYSSRTRQEPANWRRVRVNLDS